VKRKKKNKLLIPALVIILFLAIVGSFGETSDTPEPNTSGSSEIGEVLQSEPLSTEDPQPSESEAPSEEAPAEETPVEVPNANEQEEAPTQQTPAAEPPVSEVETPVEMPATPPQDSTFEVHFIDVGQGDCSLVLCDGHAMLIDGGESSESSKVYAYLKAHGIDHLDYMVATHAHSDHIGGLSGALNYASVDVAFCPVTQYDTKTFASMVKYLGNQGVSITVPSAGDSFMLGSASVQILGPDQHHWLHLRQNSLDVFGLAVIHGRGLVPDGPHIGHVRL